MNMTDALRLIDTLRTGLWNGLNSLQVPLLGVSFIIFYMTIFMFNVVTKFLAVLTNSSQDKDGGRYDNNNNYIYKRG